MDSAAKVDAEYCRDVVLSQRLLPAVCKLVTGDFFVFQKGSSAPSSSQATRETVKLLAREALE